MTRNEKDVLAAARASMGRRVLGLGCLGFLGLLLVYMAVVNPPALHWQFLLIVLGAAAIWLADAMRRATASEVYLTEEAIRDADGTLIARLDEIVGLDRGFFAFKPSNGFLLTLKTAQGRVWRPGLWWRLGRRVGIGGMTPGHQTKMMSEILAAMMAQRDLAK